MKVALDAMGGDVYPAPQVEGSIAALLEYPDLEVVLVGDTKVIEAELAKHPGYPKDRLTLFHASEVITMTDGAVEGVRKKKDSSLNRGVEMVKEGKAEAIVSAGNTGAIVACSQLKLRTLPGIERPGIATVMPTTSGHFLLIDAGANPDPEPSHLVGYAIMGSIYSREVLGKSNPRVGLISIGSEASKGNEFTRETFKLLQEVSVINFAGNIEGHELFRDPTEVVVCDGFVGNVVLKTSESLAKAIFGWLKAELQSTLFRTLGAWLAKGAFLAIKKKTNTDEYGGMPLLGVNGIVIKAHGNSNAKAIKNALRVARESVRQQVNRRIIAEMSRHHESHQAAPSPAPSTT
ncbi:MAG: phosphate acyltransferase PlsX [Candidatus Methylacidiphilales bacterium]|nr:phosphate acyltransferase PlsX [Candidatus Methylacidiphilales bacterium]